MKEIPRSKHQLRAYCRQVRIDLGEPFRREASTTICGTIKAWGVFQASRTILTYMPMRAEVDLSPLLTECPEKRWLLPRIIPEENNRMAFHEHDPARLVRHAYGMLEPAAGLPEVSPGEVQLAFVPGLAFDCRGWRLGYGGGYFDRFLGGFSGVSAGVTFRALLLEDLPHQAHDRRVSCVVSEAGIIKVAT